MSGALALPAKALAQEEAAGNDADTEPGQWTPSQTPSAKRKRNGAVRDNEIRAERPVPVDIFFVIIAFWALVVSLMFLYDRGAGENGLFDVDVLAFSLIGGSGLVVFLLLCCARCCVHRFSANMKDPPDANASLQPLFVWIKAMGAFATTLLLLAHANWILALVFATCAAFSWAFFCGIMTMVLARMLKVRMDNFPMLAHRLLHTPRVWTFGICVLSSLLETGTIYFKTEGHLDFIDEDALDQLGLDFLLDLRRWELLLAVSVAGWALSLLLTPFYLALRRHGHKEIPGPHHVRAICGWTMVSILASWILHLHSVLCVVYVSLALTVGLALGLLLLPLGLCYLACVWCMQEKRAASSTKVVVVTAKAAPTSRVPEEEAGTAKAASVIALRSAASVEEPAGKWQFSVVPPGEDEDVGHGGDLFTVEARSEGGESVDSDDVREAWPALIRRRRVWVPWPLVLAPRLLATLSRVGSSSVATRSSRSSSARCWVTRRPGTCAPRSCLVLQLVLSSLPTSSCARWRLPVSVRCLTLPSPRALCQQ